MLQGSLLLAVYQSPVPAEDLESQPDNIFKRSKTMYRSKILL